MNTTDWPENPEQFLEELCRDLDEIAQSAEDPTSVLQRFGDSYYSDPASEAASLIKNCLERALAYTFEEDPNHRASLQLGRRRSSTTPDWPPAFDEVPEQEKSVWLRASEFLTAPILLAHFKDLALVSGARYDRDTAREAARLYLSLTQIENIDGFHLSSCLRRAWTICRQFGIPDESEVRHRLYQVCTKKFGLGVTPGELSNLLSPLAVPPRNGEYKHPTRTEVRSMLLSVRPQFADNFLAEKISDLLFETSDSPEERTEARRFLVDSQLRTAERNTGIARISWLSIAAESAKKHQIADLFDEAILQLQAPQPENLQLQKLRVDSHIPIYSFDIHLRSYLRAQDIHTALRMWLSTGSPTGDHRENLEFARDQAANRIVSYVTRIQLDQDLLPRNRQVGNNGAEEYWLELKEQISFQFNGQILARDLSYIRKLFPEVSPERIASSWISQYQCDPTLALYFARAIHSFWAGRYSDAGRAAFPLIEAGARGLLLNLGDPLYRIQTGTSDGKFPSLEKYISKLEERDFDADWIRFLRHPVASLRNSIAHGHLLELSEIESAILLRAAGLLVLLSSPHSSDEDRSHVDSRLRDPISWVGTYGQLVPQAQIVWAPHARFTCEEE